MFKKSIFIFIILMIINTNGFSEREIIQNSDMFFVVDDNFIIDEKQFDISVVISKNKKNTATLYNSNKNLEDNSYLKIQTTSYTAWINDINGYTFIYGNEFLDDNHLVFYQNTHRGRKTYLFNLEKKDIRYFGNGTLEVIKKGKYKGMYLSSSSSYPLKKNGETIDTVYVDVVKSPDGEMIIYKDHVNGEECIPLKSFLDLNRQFPRLEQTFDECVKVERR